MTGTPYFSNNNTPILLIISLIVSEDALIINSIPLVLQSRLFIWSDSVAPEFFILMGTSDK